MPSNQQSLNKRNDQKYSDQAEMDRIYIYHQNENVVLHEKFQLSYFEFNLYVFCMLTRKTHHNTANRFRFQICLLEMK